MKRLATFALAVLSCVPASAQFGGMGGGPATQVRSIETELLELEQDVDKTILRGALMLQGHKGLEAALEAKPEKSRDDKGLRDFIARKKDAIIERATELRRSRMVGMGRPAAAVQPAQTDRETAIEKSENAQIEAQLLEAQINLLQPSLAKAIELLAAAELAASNDQKQRPKADDARRVYEKLKAKQVEHKKRLRLEEQQVGGMAGVGGMGGMGGGMR